MATVVVDNTNPEQMLALARGEKIEPPKVEKTEEKPAEEAKPVEGEAKPVETTDDVEDEEGLTAVQKRELSDKIKSVVGKKHRQMKSAEEFAADQYNQRQLADQRAENLQREVERLKAAKPPEQIVAEAKEPKREDFKTEQEYQDARVDWRADQKFIAKQAEIQQQQRQQMIDRAAASIDRAIELVPDYKERIKDADYIVPNAVTELMVASDLFAEMGLHFVDHPEDLGKLAVLPPNKLKVEFRKIESKLSPFAASPAPKVNGNGTDKPSTDASQASSTTDASQSRSRAAVIKPLSSGSAVQVEKSDAEMSPQEALQAWQKKHGVNLVGRKRH